MKKLIIMRGLPGSGKTYEVEKIISGLKNITKLVCSADHFFTNSEGEYNFDPSRIGKAHMACQISALQAMANGIEVVFIDNTNTQRWEFFIYTEMAYIFGYTIEYKIVGGFGIEDVMEYAKRNTHGVPQIAIANMVERFEK